MPASDHVSQLNFGSRYDGWMVDLFHLLNEISSRSSLKPAVSQTLGIKKTEKRLRGLKFVCLIPRGAARITRDVLNCRE